MVEQLRQSAIEGPWETAERLLVCVGADTHSLDVVRAASRLATGLNASWVARHRRAPTGRSAAAGAGAVEAALNLARSLGARAERLIGRDLRDRNSRLRAAREHHPDRLGRSRASLAGDSSAARSPTRSCGAQTRRHACRYRRRARTDEGAPPWIARLPRRPGRDWRGLAWRRRSSVAGAVGLGEALTLVARCPTFR